MQLAEHSSTLYWTRSKDNNIKLTATCLDGASFSAYGLFLTEGKIAVVGFGCWNPLIEHSIIPEPNCKENIDPTENQ
jgi:hypothetical protein